jgi:hypothetical protein
MRMRVAVLVKIVSGVEHSGIPDTILIVILSFKFSMDDAPGMASIFLCTLLALFTPEHMRKTSPYLVVDFC